MAILFVKLLLYSDFSNPKVQVASMDAGAMEQLVRMSSLEPSSGVRSHVLYALSALIRHFPYAQQRFLQLGGMHSLKGLFSQPDTAKLRLRAVTLINDMLLEQVGMIRNKLRLSVKLLPSLPIGSVTVVDLGLFVCLSVKTLLRLT